MKQILINVSSIDWKELREQKAHLLEILADENSSVTAEQHISIEGVVSLINHVQDEAVDYCEVDEEEIFGKMETE